MSRILKGRANIYFGWWLVIASIFAMAFSSGLGFFSYGLFVEPLEDDFGWSRAQVSLGFSFAFLTAGLSAPLVGRFVDVRGPRLSILVGTFLTAASFIVLAQTENLWQWYAFRAINAGFHQMIFFIPINALISRWFVAHRGVALLLVGVGVQLGGFLMAPLVQVVIIAFDWDGAFYFSAALTAAFFLPAAFFVFRDSPGPGGLPDSETRRSQGDAPVQPYASLSIAQAIRAPHYWLIAVGFSLLIFGITGWAVHQVPFWVSVGYSQQTAVLLASLVSGVSILARLGFSPVVDGIERYEGLTSAAGVVLAIGVLALSFEAGILVIAVFVLCRSLGGVAMMLQSMLLLKSFGLAHFASLLGIVVVVQTVSEIASPWIAGLLFDSTGSYDAALFMFAAAFLLAAATFSLAGRLPRPLDLAAKT